jgi:murein DD-endopeptidase
MVNLALEPPNSTGSRSPRRFPKLLAVALIVLASGAGGFVLGRRTADHALFEALPPPAPSSSASPSPVTATPNASRMPAAPPASAQGAPQPAQTAPAAAVTAPAQPADVGTPSLGSLKRLALTLRGPLEQNITAALPPEDRALAEELTQMLNRILVWHLQVSRDARRGDQVEVLYTLPAPEQREPIVEAVRYTSVKLGRTFEAFRYRPEGSPFARYYQPDGSEVEERLLDGPIVDYEQVTSLLRDGRRHKGVDFKTPVGSPVLAPFDGAVVRRNWHFSANGNCVDILDAASGRHAIFLHLQSVPKEMQPGTKVRKGQLIAHSGNSGHSTAPHLHYQLESADGRILDPFEIHKTRRIALQGAAKAGFDEQRARLEGLLTKG